MEEFWKNKSLQNLTTEFDGIFYSEQWKDIFGYEGYYAISSFGRVKSLDRISCAGNHIKQKIRKAVIPRHGYPTVELCKDSLDTRLLIHRLVAIHFLPPSEYSDVLHLDDNKGNPFFKNLMWGNASMNMKQAFERGRKNYKGENHPKAILTNESVLEIFNSSLRHSELSIKFNIDQSVITHIKTGRLWSHVTQKKLVRTKKRLTKDMVLEILRSNESNDILASKYGVVPETIWSIKTKRTWKNITY